MENKQELVKEIIDVCGQYDYSEGCGYDLTEHGVGVMLEWWWENKQPIIEWMSQSPNYDGNYKIVLSEQYAREIDKDEMYRFWDYLREGTHLGRPVSFTPLVISQEQICGCCDEMKKYVGVKMDVDEYCHHLREGFVDMRSDNNRWVWDSRYCDTTFEDQDLYGMNTREFSELGRLVREVAEKYLSEENINRLNEVFPWLRVSKGAKTSRAVRKICLHFGIEKKADFNRHYTRYADAVNPLNITRWTIISAHPVDYLTMSFGNSWASCHTIDKTNKRGMPNNYSGMYSGGTLSYMLDGTSLVLYIVDRSYNGTHFELEPKINRQMFHIGEDKIVQGRLYPQDNDCGSGEMYTQLRETVQRVYAQCTGTPNLWKVSKGTGACGEVIESHGVHYKDYECYNNCNVSFQNIDGSGEKNMTPIHVGHGGICPRCGSVHFNEDCILCDDCREERVFCAHCGEEIIGVGIEINDRIYCCPECAEEEGYVECDDGEWHCEGDSDVLYDDWLGVYCYDQRGYWEDAIYIDGYRFCCEENAIEFGFRRCEKCGDWVWERDFNEVTGLCRSCDESEEEVS